MYLFNICTFFIRALPLYTFKVQYVLLADLSYYRWFSRITRRPLNAEKLEKVT